MTTARPRLLAQGLTAGDWVVSDRKKYRHCLGRLATNQVSDHARLYWLNLRNGQYWLDATWTKWLTKVEPTDEELARWAIAQLTK